MKHELFPCLDLDLFPLQEQEVQEELEEETYVLLVPSGPPGAETRHAASSPQGPTPLASVRPWPGPFLFDGLEGLQGKCSLCIQVQAQGVDVHPWSSRLQGANHPQDLQVLEEALYEDLCLCNCPVGVKRNFNASNCP